MIAESADIKFACSQCGQRIVVDKAAAGMHSNCPICEGPVTVPHCTSVEERKINGIGAHSDRGSYVDPGLDDTREELFSSTVELGRVNRELDEANAEIERLKSLFKKAVDECERITASATHAQAEIKSFQADRTQLKADLSTSKQRALAAENQVAELSAALAIAQHGNTTLQQQYDQESAVRGERESVVQTQLELRERELAAARGENSEIVQSLAAGQAELSSLQAEVSGLRQELGAAQQLLNEAAENENKLVASKHELEARLDQAGTEGRIARNECHELQEQARILRQDLSKSDVGAELLDVRGQLKDLMDDRAAIAETLAEKRSELKTLETTAEGLRDELSEACRKREEAERQAAINSESQMNKDNDVLRGIVARQNTTLGVYYTEVRRMRRARYGLRIVYGLFGLALLALVAFAVSIFTHQGIAAQFSQFIK